MTTQTSLQQSECRRRRKECIEILMSLTEYGLCIVYCKDRKRINELGLPLKELSKFFYGNQNRTLMGRLQEILIRPNCYRSRYFLIMGILGGGPYKDTYKWEFNRINGQYEDIMLLLEEHPVTNKKGAMLLAIARKLHDEAVDLINEARNKGINLGFDILS